MDRIQFWLLFGLILLIITEVYSSIENLTTTVGIIGIIIGIVLSSLVGYSIETYRNRKIVRFDHLFDIKQKCLEKIKGNLIDIYRRFEFYDPKPKPDALKTYLDYPSHWWDRESIGRWILDGSDSGLYKDLAVHKITSVIPKKMDDIEKELPVISPKFHTAYIGLYDAVSKRVSNDTTIDSTKKDNYLTALLNVAMGERDEFRNWPSTFNKVKEDGLLKKLDSDKKIVMKYNESKEFIKVKTDVFNLLHNGVDVIDTILDSYELNDDCKYVKAKV